MSSSFRYTGGEGFTLDNLDYAGFYNVVDGKAYTGKIKTNDSEELIPKNNFLSDLLLSGEDLDAGYGNITQPTSYFSNSFDVFNKQELDKILNIIDRNNLLIFKSLILRHPHFYQVADNNCHFYGLSSTDSDIRNDDLLHGKTIYTHIDPFSLDAQWKFVDDIRVGTFLVDSSDNFKYICSTGTVNYTLNGNFSNIKELEVGSVRAFPFTEHLHEIYNDEISNRISYVNNDFINIYDSTNYADCDELILVDQVELQKTSTVSYIFGITRETFGAVPVTFKTRYVTTNHNNPKFIKFGNKLRTGLSPSRKILNLFDKYSIELSQTLKLENYGIGRVLSLDIRSEDDHILILHTKKNLYYVTLIDPSNLKTIKTTQIEGFDFVVVPPTHPNFPTFNPDLYYTSNIVDMFKTGDVPTIKFSQLDSNLFYTYHQKQFQTRYLSAPTYLTASLEKSDLKYLDIYYFGQTLEKFNATTIKWNSNKMTSNSYNNLLFNEYIANGKMYSLLHNVGRLYSLKQPFFDSLLTPFPLDTQKYFDGVKCSESSFGLYFNNSISNLVKDTLNLYNQSAHTFTIYKDRIEPKLLEDISFEIENLYLNGNEAINIISVQRILLLLTEIQSRLISKSI